MNDFPFNYFLTKKNISLQKIQNIPNLSDIIKINTKESILKKYKNNIEEYIKKNNLKISDIEKFKYLENISNNFNTLLITKNVEEFVHQIISRKNIITNINKNIEEFYKLSSNKNRNKNYSEKFKYNNPIKYEFFNFDIETYFKKYEANLLKNNNDLNNIKKMIDILSYGDSINLSLPSIGLLKINISKQDKININNFTSFIKSISSIDNTDKYYNIIQLLPIRELDIENKISDYLLDINYSKLNINFDKNNFIFIDHNKSKNLIINNIKNIELKINDIFIENNKKNKKNKRNNRKDEKINGMYLIPYILDSTNNSIRVLKKPEIDSKLKNYESFIDHNNSIIKYVINKVFKEDNGIENLDNANYKNVLASFLFVNIQIIYEIYKKYFLKIDNIIIELSESSEKRFGILNIEKAFNYVMLLKKSLFHFKNILLNNFYNLFLPAKISKNSYGMKKIEGDCFVPESNFLNDTKNIYENYPFNKFYSNESINDNNKNRNKNINEISSENRIVKFITIIENKYDIYNKNDILEFGGNAFDKNIIDSSFKFLINYYKIIETNNKFILFIIDKIINYFNEDKNIPYELLNIEKLENSINLFYNDSSQNFIEQDLLKNLEYSYEKFTSYYIQYLNLKNKISHIGKTNVNIFNYKLMSELCLKIYLNRAQVIYSIPDKNIIDTKRKNELIAKFNQKILYYKKIIDQEKKKIDKLNKI
jgi:hypothetical protein